MADVPGTGRAPRILTTAVVIVVWLVVCAGCTTSTSAPSSGATPGPTTHEVSSAAPSDPSSALSAVAGPVIGLKCADGSSGRNYDGRMVLGVTSDAWSHSMDDLDFTSLPVHDGLTLVKSPLYVSGAAQSGTRVEVTSPKSAGLYYTTWGVWGRGPTPEVMVTGARRAVTVGGCGSEALGFPGGIVVDGPSCVTLRLTSGDGAQHEDLQLAIGRACQRG